MLFASALRVSDSEYKVIIHSLVQYIINTIMLTYVACVHGGITETFANDNSCV